MCFIPDPLPAPQTLADGGTPPWTYILPLTLPTNSLVKITTLPPAPLPPEAPRWLTLTGGHWPASPVN